MSDIMNTRDCDDDQDDLHPAVAEFLARPCTVATGLSDDLLAELESIGKPQDDVTLQGEVSPVAVAPKDRPRPYEPMRAPDPSDPNVIIDQPELTRYDKKRAELQKALEKRDTLLSTAPLSIEDQRRVDALNIAIPHLQQKFDKEAQRGLTDLGRLQDSIDAHRAGDGRESYNAKRRKVRGVPNISKDASPDEKALAKKQKAALRKFRFNLKAKGLPDHEVEHLVELKRLAT